MIIDTSVMHSICCFHVKTYLPSMRLWVIIQRITAGTFLRNFFQDLFYMYEFSLRVYMCTTFMLVNPRGQKREWDYLKWELQGGWHWTTIWLLRTKLGSSCKRVASVLNCWTVSPAPEQFCCYVMFFQYLNNMLI